MKKRQKSCVFFLLGNLSAANLFASVNCKVSTTKIQIAQMKNEREGSIYYIVIANKNACLELMDTTNLQKVKTLSNWGTLFTDDCLFDNKTDGDKTSKELITENGKRESQNKKRSIIQKTDQNVCSRYLILNPGVLGQGQNSIKEVAEVATGLMN